MSEPVAPPEHDLESRIAALESTVRTMREDLAELRAELRREPAPRGGSAFGAYAPVPEPPFPPRPQAPGPRPFSKKSARNTWSSEEFESLLGRYGMLALGGLTLLAAVGLGVRWAVGHFVLGPEVRVALGLMAALAVGYAGYWLRPKSRSYGSALMGLALAIVHLDAWAAGPQLGIVPAPVALAVATLASVALAVFATLEQDEALWCLGFGGAALAPFVTSTGGGSAIALATYGAAVMIAGAYSLGERQWRVAHRVTLLSAAWYVFALAAMPTNQGSPTLAVAFPFAIAFGGIIPCAGDGSRRARIRALGVLAMLAAMGVAGGRTGIPGIAPVAIVGVAFALWIAMSEMVAHEPPGPVVDGFRSERDSVADWVDAAWIPLGFIASGLLAIRVFADPAGIAVASTGALILATLAERRDEGSARRDGAVFAACVSALLVIPWTTDTFGQPAAVMLIAALGVVFALGDRKLPSRSWSLMATLTLVLASFVSLQLLEQRTAWDYTPFLNMAALSAAVVALAWLVLAKEGEPGAVEGVFSDAAGAERMPPEAVRYVAAGLWAFTWVLQEASGAVSPRIASVLVILWMAVTSVAAVWFGRRRDLAAVRVVGLLLAVATAARAAYGAASLDETWAQVAGYLVASGFLMGIAWWYRRGSQTGTSPS